MYHAVLRCTISILRIWSLWSGLHTTEQYSRFDLTILKYAFAVVSSLQDLRFRRRKPSMLFDFLEILSMCVFQESADCTSTSRYFVESCSSRTWPFSWYENVIGERALVMLKTLHFCGWNAIPHFDSHSAKVLRSSCNTAQSSGLSICRYTIQSSAKRLLIVSAS